MKTFTIGTLFLAFAFLAITSSASAGVMFVERIEFGSAAGQFFDNLLPNSSSHTNSLSVTNSGIKLDVTVTVEGFDENGDPAPLNAGNAAGVDGLGVSVGEENQINPSESIRVTFDSVAFSLMPPAPGFIVDPASFLNLSSVRLAAFNFGTDFFTYSGLGAGGITGDDTQEIEVDVPISDGDSFTIKSDGGDFFRLLYVSLDGMSDVMIDPFIPEPSTALLSVVMLGSVAGLRRRK